MHVHILGICGTFMAGIALLARQLGWKVTGSDTNIYPPMSTLLQDEGIGIVQGYNDAQLQPAPDCVVIGNALSRGNEAVEYVLDHNLPFASGPGFLARHILQRYKVLAVAGTHGKTTTASLLAWLLEDAGLEPGFLIGGIPQNFGVSARLGGGDFFVVEADEYDTAFFDKRAKFVHYKPHTLILNNLEFDHADIYPDLAAIQWQFHQLLRIVPGSSLIIAPRWDTNLQQVIQRGCWTPVQYLDTRDGDDTWSPRFDADDNNAFDICYDGHDYGRVSWTMTGRHNVFNALAAIAAANHAGVAPARAAAALGGFKGVKRRLEVLGTARGITLYDDFAHHPTAIEATLAGLRSSVRQQRIIAILEPRSNTMRMGCHQQTLASSLAAADYVFLYQPPELEWSLHSITAALDGRARVLDAVDDIVAQVVAMAAPGDHIVIMSNGSFGGIHARLKEALLT